MKKVLCAILCAALCVMLCAGLCGCKTMGSVIGQEDDGVIAKDPSVIFENEYCKQTVGSAGFDSYGNYLLSTTVENKTDMPLSVEWRTGTVNGWVANVWEHAEIAANSSVVQEMRYYNWELEKAGITSVDELRFYVMISEQGSYSQEDVYSAETYYYYPEGKSAEEIDRFERQPQDGDIVVEESDLATFIVESIETDDEGNWIINYFLANNSDELLNYSVDSLTVDGWIVDAYSVSVYMLPDSCRCDQIMIDKLVAEKSGINTPTELTFSVNKSDPEDHKIISEETITVYNSSAGLVEVQSSERVPVDGEVTMVDNEHLTMIVEECCEGEFAGSVFNCYFKNNSDTEINITIDEIAADGEIHQAFWYQTLAPGVKVWFPIDVSSLEDFENVKKFEFSIEVSNEDYEDIMHERVAYEP